MGTLKDLLTVNRGRYRAHFDGGDLGELASPPEIKADYNASTLLIRGEDRPSEKLEGCRELQAKITLKLKAVDHALLLLENIPENGRNLQLINSDLHHRSELLFPETKLLPVWEFEPSFTGDHLITLHFFARNTPEGKLFYFSGT